MNELKAEKGMSITLCLLCIGSFSHPKVKREHLLYQCLPLSMDQSK